MSDNHIYAPPHIANSWPDSIEFMEKGRTRKKRKK